MNFIKKEQLKETARDTLALGSWAFCILVIARSSIDNYLEYTYQIIFSLLLLLVFGLFIKNSENHIARYLILAVFTILFYNEVNFTIVAIIVFILLLISAVYLDIKKTRIIIGILLGSLSSLIIYYSSSFLIKLFSLPV